MKKLRSILLNFVLLLICGVAAIMAGCGDPSAASVSLSLSGLTNKAITLTIGENDSAKVTATINGYNNSISREINFSTDSSCIKIKDVQYYSNGRAVAEIVAVAGGTAEVKVQTHEFGKTETFKVYVLEPVKSISIKQGVQVFYEEGQGRLYLNPEELISYEPASTTDKAVTFEFFGDGSDGRVLEYDNEVGMYYVDNLKEDTELIVKSEKLAGDGVSLNIGFRNKIEYITIKNDGDKIYDSSNAEQVTPSIMVVKNQKEFSQVQLAIDVGCNEDNIECYAVYENSVIVEKIGSENKYFTFSIQSADTKKTGTVEFHFVADGYEYATSTVLVNVDILEAPKTLKINGYSNITDPMYVYTGYQASIGERLNFTATPSNDIPATMYLVLDSISEDKLTVYDSLGMEVAPLANLTKTYYQVPENNILYLKADTPIQTQFYVSAIAEYTIANQRFETSMYFPIITLEEVKDVNFFYTDEDDREFQIEEDDYVSIDLNSDHAYKDINFYSDSGMDDKDILVDFTIVNESNIASVTVLDSNTLRVTALGTGISYFKIRTGNGYESRLNLRFIRSVDIEKIKVDLQEVYQNDSIIRKSYENTGSSQIEDDIFGVITGNDGSFEKTAFEAEIENGSLIPIIYAVNQEGVTNLSVEFGTENGEDFIDIYFSNNSYYIQSKNETDGYIKCYFTFRYRYVENNLTTNDIYDAEYTIYFYIKAYIKLDKLVITTSKNSNDFTLYDYNSVGFFNDDLSRAMVTTTIYPETLNPENYTLTWSTNTEADKVFEHGEVLGIDSYGNRIYPYTFNTSTGELICRVDTEELPVTKISITATVSYQGVNYSKSIQFNILRAKRVESISIKTDEVVLNYDSKNKDNISYTFKPKTNPADAYSSKLSCMFVPADLSTPSDLFIVSEIPDGFVVSYNPNNNKGEAKIAGDGFVRIIALDSYQDANNYTVYVDIPISLRDGSYTSPIQIVTAKQFVEIQDFSMHYQIVGTIDLSNYKQSQYTGKILTGSISGAGNAEITGIYLDEFLLYEEELVDGNFTRYAYSSLFAEIRKEGEDEHSGLIENVKFTGSISPTITVTTADKEKVFFDENNLPRISYTGLVAAINKGKLLNISVCLNSSAITVHASLGARGPKPYILYAGGVVGRNSGQIINDLTMNPTYTNLIYNSTNASFNVNDMTAYSIYEKPSTTQMFLGGVTARNDVGTGIIARIVPENYTSINGTGNTTDLNLKYNVVSYGSQFDKAGPNTLYSSVGMIAAYNTGSVSGVVAQGQITAPRLENIGGIAGYLDGQLNNCTSGVFVYGNYHVGGLVGQLNGGKIENCRVEALETTSIRKTLVVGNDFVGGLVGKALNVASITNSYFISFITTYEPTQYSNSLGYIESVYYGDILMMSKQHPLDDTRNMAYAGHLFGDVLNSNKANIKHVYADACAQVYNNITVKLNDIQVSTRGVEKDDKTLDQKIESYIIVGYSVYSGKEKKEVALDNTANNDVVNYGRNFTGTIDRSVFKSSPLIVNGVTYDYTFIIAAPNSLGLQLNKIYYDFILNKEVKPDANGKELLSLYFYHYDAVDDNYQSNIDFMNKLNNVFSFKTNKLNVLSSNTDVITIDGITGIKIVGTGQTVLTFSSVYNSKIQERILINVIKYIGEMTIHQNADRENAVQDNSSLVLDLDASQMIYTDFNESVGNVITADSIGAGAKVIIKLVEMNGTFQKVGEGETTKKFLVQFDMNENSGLGMPIKVFYGDNGVANVKTEASNGNPNRAVDYYFEMISTNGTEEIVTKVKLNDLDPQLKEYTVEYSLTGRPEKIYALTTEEVKHETNNQTNEVTYFLYEKSNPSHLVLGNQLTPGDLFVNGVKYEISEDNGRYYATFTEILKVNEDYSLTDLVGCNEDIGGGKTYIEVKPVEKVVVEKVKVASINNLIVYYIFNRPDTTTGRTVVFGSSIAEGTLVVDGVEYVISKQNDDYYATFVDSTRLTIMIGENHIPALSFRLEKVGTEGYSYLLVPNEKCDAQDIYIVEYMEFTSPTFDGLISYKTIQKRVLTFKLDTSRIIGDYLTYNGSQYLRGEKDNSFGTFWDGEYYTKTEDGEWELVTNIDNKDKKLLEDNSSRLIAQVLVESTDENKTQSYMSFEELDLSVESVLGGYNLIVKNNVGATSQISCELVGEQLETFITTPNGKFKVLGVNGEMYNEDGDKIYATNPETLSYVKISSDSWKFVKDNTYLKASEKHIVKLKIGSGWVRVDASEVHTNEAGNAVVVLKNTSATDTSIWKVNQLNAYYLTGHSQDLYIEPINGETMSVGKYKISHSGTTLILEALPQSVRIDSEKVDFVIYDVKTSDLWIDYKVIQGTREIKAKTYEIVATPQDEAVFDIVLDSENLEEQIYVEIEIINYNKISDDISNSDMFELRLNRNPVGETIIFNGNKSATDVNGYSRYIVSKDDIEGFKFSLKLKVKENARSFVDARQLKITLTAASNGRTVDLYTTFNPQPVVAVLTDLYSKVEYESTDPGYNLSVYDREYYSYISTNQIVPGQNSLFELNIFPEYVGFNYVEIININNEYNVMFESFTGTNNLVSISNGVRLYETEFTDGRVQLRAFVSSDIDDQQPLNLEIKVYNYKQELMFVQPLVLYSDQTPGVQMTLKGHKTTAKAEYEDNIYVARGLTYDLGVEVFDFTFDEVVFNISNPEYVSLVRDVNNNFFLKITNAAIDYPLDSASGGFDVTITAYGSRIEDNDVIQSEVTTLHITIVEFVVNGVGETEGSIVTNVKDGVYRSSVGNTISLSLSFNREVIEYAEDNLEVANAIDELLKELSVNGLWSVRSEYSNKTFDISEMQSISTNENGNAEIWDAFSKYYTVKYNSVTEYYTVTFLRVPDGNDPTFIFSYSGYFKYIKGRPTASHEDSENNYSLGSEFTFDIFQRTDSRTPFPVRTYKEMLEMRPGAYYILLEDIVVTANEYQPINTAIAGFDGNNKTITFENITYTGSAETSLGLFGTVDTDTIIQNVKILVRNTVTIEASSVEKLTFGLIAGKNDGKITNCSVEGDNSALVNLVVGDYGAEGESNHSLATLVGVNNGYITNSRVEVSFKSSGNIGGFVCSNAGFIRACYVSNASITNQSSLSQTYTAGFVLSNETGALIDGCYISGSYLRETDQYANDTTKSVNSSYGCAAFVYTNESTIVDCYANIPVTTKAISSGFVFKNNVSGIIKNCYSTSKMENNTSAHTSFIGVIQNANQNMGTIINCYAIENADVNPSPKYDTMNNVLVRPQSETLQVEPSVTVVSPSLYNKSFNVSIGSNKNVPGLTIFEDKGEMFKEKKSPTVYTEIYLVERGNLAIDKMSSRDLFENSGFVISNNIYRTAGTWFFPVDELGDSDFEKNGALMRFKRMRPELVSANTIAVRERILDKNNPVTYDPVTNEETYHYLENSNYSYGSRFNPFIVASASDLELMAEDAIDSTSNGYYRLICDIDYDVEGLTQSNLYLLGLTGEIDGNNFTISNFVIDSNATLENAGFLASIGTIANQKGVVKNLVLAPKYINTPNTYSLGVLAGSLYGGCVVSVTIDGKTNSQDSSTMILLGRNIVGGIIGRATGAFNVKDITANISINSTYRASLQGNVLEFYNGYNPERVSYSGIAVGVVYGAGTISDVYIKDECVSIAENAGMFFGTVANTALVQKLNIERHEKQNIKAAVYGGFIAATINNATLQNINLTETDANMNMFTSEPFNPKAIGLIAGYMNSGEVKNVSLENYLISSTTSEITAGAVGIMEDGTLNSVYMKDIKVSGKTTVGGLVGVVGAVKGNVLGFISAKNSINIQNCDFLQGEITAKSVATEIYVGTLIGRVVILGQANVSVPDGSTFGKVAISKINLNKKEGMELPKVNVTTLNISDVTKVFIGTIGGTLEKCSTHNGTDIIDVYDSTTSRNVSISYISNEGINISMLSERWLHIMSTQNFALTLNWTDLDRTSLYFEGDRANITDNYQHLINENTETFTTDEDGFMGLLQKNHFEVDFDYLKK